MAGQFVAGATPDDLVKRLRSNAALGIATTIDLLGETVVSEAEADAFLRRNLEVLGTVGKAVAQSGAPCFSDLGPRGPLPRVNLSVKISALTPEVLPSNPERSIAALKERLRPILSERPRDRGVHQLRHGELRAEGPDARALPLHPRGGRVPRDAGGRHRAPGLPARLRGRPARPDRLGEGGEAPDRRAPRQGRLLGLRDDPGRPAGMARAGLVAEARERRELREAFGPAPRERRHRRRPRSPRTTSAPAPTRSPRPSASASTRGPTNSRRSTEWRTN